MTDLIKQTQTVAYSLALACIVTLTILDQQRQKFIAEGDAKLLLRVARIVEQFSDGPAGSVLQIPDGKYPYSQKQWSTECPRGKDEVVVHSLPQLQMFGVFVPAPELPNDNGNAVRTLTLAKVWMGWEDIVRRPSCNGDNPERVREKVEILCTFNNNLDPLVYARVGRSPPPDQFVNLPFCKAGQGSSIPEFWSMFPDLARRYDEVGDRSILAIVLPTLRSRSSGSIDFPGLKLTGGLSVVGIFLTGLSGILIACLSRLLQPSIMIGKDQELFFALWPGWVGAALGMLTLSLLPASTHLLLIAAFWFEGQNLGNITSAIGFAFSGVTAYQVLRLRRRMHDPVGGKS